MEDSKLIELLQKGDERALKELFLKFHKALRYFAIGYVKSSEVAEEFVEDVFFKVWERRLQFENVPKIQSFLYISLKNTCINYLKSPTQNKITEDIDALDHQIFQDEDLLQRLINAELIKSIFTEVDKLSPKLQRVFKLSFMEGLSIEEIAAEMDISTTAVYTNRFRAIQLLRKKLGIEEAFFTFLLAFLFIK